ncbi:type II secretion system F family protein [Actinomadura keratinilytica]|jgi:tight adherence protein B|uniref:Type II secretion system protein GspF domain-containing protein n=1 Tax=Actinomadura keratinilytica TaxID=547461 RepID=A0ABP7YEP5_9ACTN
MTVTIALAMISAAACAWLSLRPPTASERLGRMLTTRAADAWPSVGGLLQKPFTHLHELRERRKQQQRWRTAVIGLCDGMAAELAAGRTPDEAFRTAAGVLDRRIAVHLLNTPPSLDGPEPRRRPPDPVSDTQAEAPAADRLERLAERPGAEGLRLLAACWRIGAERGGTLAAALDGLAAALRDEEEQRQEIAAQLAGPRATARLLAGLPLLGLAMAAALGAKPLAFLFGTIPGLGCLATAITLDVLGMWWTSRLARAAEVPR